MLKDLDASVGYYCNRQRQILTRIMIKYFVHTKLKLLTYP